MIINFWPNVRGKKSKGEEKRERKRWEEEAEPVDGANS